MKQNMQKRKTYKQNWAEYNLAQTSEKLMFMDLLRELSYNVVGRRKSMEGKPPMDVQEMIYCMALLVYTGKSSRRVISELHISKDRGLIRKVPHFNTIIKYFNKLELTNYLEMLITMSSIPLRTIEKDYTVDASGFSTSQFERWCSYKWGKEKGKIRVWKKAHVMSGVRTNVITAIKITSQKVGDTSAFPELFRTTAHIHEMREMSGDKAYSSKKNLEMISGKGAIPYIPFRSNTSGKARGCMIWKRMYIYFIEHEEEFMLHYHKRSNAESVFSMMKRKFSQNLKMRSETGQDNEILCKALCHNICVLIQECFELNINIDLEEYARPLQSVRDYFCTHTK